MKRKREDGYCTVTSKNGCWELPRSEYAHVRAAWLKGCQFVDVVEFYGARTTIKLKHVDSVTDASPDAVNDARVDRQADEADDSLSANTA